MANSERLVMGHCDVLSLDFATPFESMEEDYHAYQTLFGDHPKGEGIAINPRSVLGYILRKLRRHGRIFALSRRHKVINLTMLRCKRFWLFRGTRAK